MGFLFYPIFETSATALCGTTGKLTLNGKSCVVQFILHSNHFLLIVRDTSLLDRSLFFLVDIGKL